MFAWLWGFVAAELCGHRWRTAGVYRVRYLHGGGHTERHMRCPKCGGEKYRREG